LLSSLDIMLADTALAWNLRTDGTWVRIRPEPGDAPLNSQDALMARAMAS